MWRGFNQSVITPKGYTGDNWGCNATGPITPICDWNGVVCGDFNPVLGVEIASSDYCGNVVFLELYNYGTTLSGTIAPEITQLTLLNILSITGTPNLVGTLPYHLEKFVRLRGLYIFETGIGGAIPKTIDAVCGLRYIDLDYNQLNGSIPNALCHLNKIIEMDLSGNALTGDVPPTICCLATLTRLLLQHNDLGCFPECVTQAPAWGSVYPVGNPVDPIPTFCFESCNETRVYMNLTTPLENLVLDQTLGVDLPFKNCARKLRNIHLFVSFLPCVV